MRIESRLEKHYFEDMKSWFHLNKKQV